MSTGGGKTKPGQIKRIAILVSVFQRGGAERQAYLLARELRQRFAVDASVYALMYDGEFREEFRKEGIPTRVIGFRRPRHFWQWPRQLFRVIRALRRDSLDAVLPFTTWPNVIVSLTYRLAGIPTCVWGERGSGSERIPGLERIAAKLASHCVTNSSAGSAFLHEELRLPHSKISVVHNGVEFAENLPGTRAWKATLGLASGQLLAVKVANITQFKDHSTLIRAWADVQTRWPADRPRPVLALAGFAGDQQDTCEQLVQEFGLSQEIRFLGSVADISSLVRAADLAVFSSRCEGMPNGVLECMAAGKPVVATDLPGIREALGPGCDDYLATVGDSTGLARRLWAMLTDEAARTRAGIRNLERAQSEFTIDRMAERMLEVVADLTGKTIGERSSADVSLRTMRGHHELAEQTGIPTG